MPERGDRGLELNTGQSGAEFDRLLRSSLETYADPGADMDLAERVLARIAAEGEHERTRRANRTRRIVRWAIALPVAACLIIAIVLLVAKPWHHSADSANEAHATLPKSTDADRDVPAGTLPTVASRRSESSSPSRHSSRAAVAASAKRLPKLDVFPAPQPLTREEKELIAYVAHTPQAERQSLIEEQKQMDAPLSIAALEIQPLEPPDTGGN